MIKRRSKINIETINALLIFVGFPAFTTIINSNVGSIAYRGFALLIAIICILKNKGQIYGLRKNKSLILFLLLYLLLTLRMVYEMYFGTEAHTHYVNSRTLVMLFTFGIGWIPFLGAVCGYKKIYKGIFVKYSFWILLSLIILGIIHKNANSAEWGRVSLNARQSTLAFGDNGAYLSIISACIFLYRKRLGGLYSYLGIVGLILGLYGTVIAGSRGPLISCIAGLLFVISLMPTKLKLFVLSSIIIGIFGGAINMSLLEELSPTMAYRMHQTIDDGDTSGREVLFEKAWKKINTDYFGANPIILESHGTFSGYHNVYLGTGVGTGIIGFLAFVLLVLTLLLRSIWNRIKLQNLFDITILSLFWYYAIRGITGVSMLSNTIYTAIFAFTCVILNYRKGTKKTKKARWVR